ncbi:exodeoxyribonuclease V subunit gamma [Ramlibacter rhizophilus]|uniref:RecBCD enzyme subunit RecC n=2 Tax=Ramlibacter rhizophilus TaxID=1781167 RepID=A0A4Z0C2J4_9BURK|nr:exodeoxyribonuclease V subunit gamma [Ramlibacter rhizophilus]
MVLHGNHPETLRALLSTWMAATPLHPLENEVVLVQSNGVAQWFKLHMASDEGQGGMGIAAAVQTQLPAQFTWTAYRALLGPGEVPAESPFDKPRLVWRLMRLLPALLEQPAFEPLRRFLRADEGLGEAAGADVPGRRLHQLCEHLADLFDQYQVWRADWLGAWAEGQDTITQRGETQPLPGEALWQPALWRALRADVGERAASRSRAEVHERFLHAAREPGRARPAGLPRRISVLGVSSMPQQVLETLAALARWCQVLLCVHNPCRHDWSRILPGHELLRAERRRQRPRRLPANAPDAPSHPLLAAWGRQGRDFIRLLDAHDEREGYDRRFEQVLRQVDCFEPNAAPGGSPSLLHRLQDDILELRDPAETRALWPDVSRDDRSIAFHIAHGPLREVEVLHDRLLAAFAADPTLSPRDVMVMVPDVAAYAPHIQAVFGQAARGDARHIPFGIADRGPGHHEPLVAALAQLLALPRSRVPASEVLDLLEVPALRRRLGLAEEDLPLLRRWIAQAQVRWGLDAAQRESLGLPPGLEQNSWAFGLRRMFLGYAVGRGQPWQGVAPMDEIGGLDAALLGPLARLVDLLERHGRALAEPVPPSAWRERLEALLDDFFDAPDGSAQALLVLRLRGALHDWARECADAALEDALPLAVVREHWLARIERGSLSQTFFTGGVTFASLMPMRAIPFRRIALLGMNDGDYPRSRPPADFDLMAHDWRAGDRSRREDDRYLFLEALLSARDHLHVSWVGRSIRDNQERPASVLVAQLRDHLAACWRLEGDARGGVEAGRALLEALSCEHRLQPFDEAYFDGRDPRIASYAREWRHAREDGPGDAPAPALALLPREEPFTLREFAGFARAPVRFFFNQRLRVHFDAEGALEDDQEPFALDALQHWKLQDELIAAQRAALDRGGDRAAVLAAGLEALDARGCLPVGALAAPVREALAEPMEALFHAYERARADWPIELQAELVDSAACALDGPWLQDWLSDLRGNARGERCRLVIDSTGLVKNKHWRLDKLAGHWVMHLAGHLGGQAMSSIVCSKAGTLRLSPLAPDQARAIWQDLAAAMAEGLARPLPFAMQAACAWIAAVDGKGEAAAREAARRCYEDHEPAFGQEAECRRDPYLGRAFPDFATLWSEGEFARLAERLLRPLQQAPRNRPEAP